MDEHAMTTGIVPVRHPSYLPGVVKLPRRYEKAALGDPKTARYRKVSLCGGPLHMRQTISARLDDLMTAIMWVKQELILLRQHDILLKRQFFNIHDSIVSLQPRKMPPGMEIPAPSLSPSTTRSKLALNGDSNKFNNNNDNEQGCSSHKCNLGSAVTATVARLARTPSSLSLSSSSSPASSPFTAKRKKTATSAAGSATGGACCCSSSSRQPVVPSSPNFNFSLDRLMVRPSSSATVLNNNNDDDDDNSDDTDGDDTFTDHYFRPRTSSMRTSRDLAALARRRGSKEFI